MTTEEQRLSEWLHEQTPQPPLSLDLAALTLPAGRGSRRPARPARGRPSHHRVAVLAAAAVVAFLAGLVTIVQGHGHAPSPATPTPRRTTTGTQTPAPTPPSPSTALTFRPWKARLIVSDDNISESLTAYGSFLYAYRDGNVLVRIAPTTGRVVARRSVGTTTAPATAIVAAADRIWVATQTSAQSVTLIGYDPLSLHPLTHRSFSTGQMTQNPALASRGSTLYIGAGDRVVVVDADTTIPTSSFQVSDGVESVSAAPDGRQVVVATSSPDGEGVIEVIDATSGNQLSRRVVYGCGSLQAVQRGYYVTCGQGHADQVTFYPFDGSAVPGAGPGVLGGGGIPATAQVSGGVVWLGGPQEAACVDPRTERVRARVTLYTNLPGGPAVQGGAALTGLSVVRGRLYAVYIGLNNTTGQGLVELTPPKACGLR